MLRSLVQLSGRGLRAHRAAHTALCIRTMSDAHKGKEYMDFPGGKVPFTEDMQWQGPGYSSAATIPCYRAIGPQGEPLPDASVPHTLDKDTALKMYKTMVDLQAVDTIFYEAQRQVRGACVCVCFWGGGWGGWFFCPLRIETTKDGTRLLRWGYRHPTTHAGMPLLPWQRMVACPTCRAVDCFPARAMPCRAGSPFT